MKTRRQLSSRFKKVNYDFTISNISFPTIQNSKFRLISNCDAEEEKITLKIEKLKSPQQWQTEITDITKHGPSGFPKGAIFTGFKRALEQFVDEEKESIDENLKGPVESQETSEDEPFLEAEIQDGGAFLLSLFVPIMGFPVEFTFKLLPVAREHIDILETALRDAEEEIELLKRENAEIKMKLQSPSFITLRSTTVCGNGGVMAWNVLEHNSAPSTFTVSDNHQSIRVKASGFYQISVRITSPDSGGGRALTLRMNNQAISYGYNGFNTGYNGSIQISDLIRLNENDELSVLHNANNNTNNSAMTNQFWIMKIA